MAVAFQTESWSSGSESASARFLWQAACILLIANIQENSLWCSVGTPNLCFTLLLSQFSAQLNKSGLALTASAEESRKTVANSSSIITYSTSWAITSRFISVSIQRIRSRGALLMLTLRTTVSRVTDTTNCFDSIPRFRIYTIGMLSQIPLRPAGAAIIAHTGTYRSLACDTFVSCEAGTGSGLAVAVALVRTFCPGMEIVRVYNSPDPSKIVRADT